MHLRKSFLFSEEAKNEVKSIIFQSDVARGSNRPTQVMAYRIETEHANDMNDLATSNSISGIATGDVETLGSKIVGGFTNILHVDFRKRGIYEEGKEQHAVKVVDWTKITWITHEHFKICDTDVTVLDICDHLKIKFICDSVQTFDTRLDETNTAMQKQLHVERLQILYFRQLEKSDQLK